MQDRRTCQICSYSRAGPGILAGTGLILTLVLLACSVSGAVFLKNGSDITGDDPFGTIIADANTTAGDYSAEFFYDPNCGACHLAMAYLTEYSAANPDISINFIDIVNRSQNRALFEEFKTAYHRKYVSVPVVFIGNAGLEGEPAIRENLEPLLSWHIKNGNNTPLRNVTPVSVSATGSHRTVISIPLVLLAGIIDGINPCACAVLIFLLICLMTIRERKRVIQTGVAFSGSVFLFYFLTGTGLYTFTKNSGFVTGFSLVCGIIAVIAGVALIIRAIFPGRGPGGGETGRGEEMPGYLEQFTMPLVFLLGLLVGILELPCSGGIYISILDMISFRVNMEQGFVYLFFYNLAFIIPLLILTSLVYWVRPEDQSDERRSEQHRFVPIFIGLLLIFFAFLILSGVI